MTYGEFMIQLKKDPVVGKLFPLETRKTFPVFTMERDALLLTYIGVSAQMGEKGLRITPPTRLMTVSYPAGVVHAYRQLAGGELHPAASRDSEKIRQAAALRDQILLGWEERSPHVGRWMNQYHSLVAELLEPDQKQALRDFGSWQ